MTNSTTDPLLACDMTAIAPHERAVHSELARRLFTETRQEIQELPDGYAFRFDAEAYTDLVAFIANERRCCPFFQFTVEVSPNAGPLQLTVSGGRGVKEFLRAELGI